MAPSNFIPYTRGLDHKQEPDEIKRPLAVIWHSEKYEWRPATDSTVAGWVLKRGGKS